MFYCFHGGYIVLTGQVISFNTYWAQGLTMSDLEECSYGMVTSANLLLEDGETVAKVSQNNCVDVNDWFNLKFGTVVSFEVLGSKPTRARVLRDIRSESSGPSSRSVDDAMEEEFTMNCSSSSSSSTGMSDYETDSDSFDSDREFQARGGRSLNVFKTYREQKKESHDKINTQAGLYQAVKRFDTAKNSGANTNLLYHGPDDTHTLYQKGTALGVVLFLQRFKEKRTGARITVSSENAQAKWGKDQHVHTEMHLLWILTEGVKDAITGVMNGGTLIVDKPICWDCYQRIKEAAPAVIRDNYTGAEKDQKRWDKWTDPFDLRPKK